MTDETKDALRRLSDWIEVERMRIGSIDGYDYRSGEEFGLRRVQCEIDRIIKTNGAEIGADVREI